MKNTAIIFYDGDGGGLCAHLRHRFEIYIISKLQNLVVYDHYPYTRYMLKDTKIINELYHHSNTIMMDEIVKQSESFEHLLENIEKTRALYILSGRHHYTSLFKVWIQKKGQEYVFSKYIEFMGLLNKQLIEQLIRGNINSFHGIVEPKYEIAIHIRSLIDSPEGYQKYRQKRSELFGWLISQVASKLSQTDNARKNIFIASDNRKEMHLLESLLAEKGFNIVLGQEFGHTTLARWFGIDILQKTQDFDYQMYVSINQMRKIKQEDLSWDIVAEIFEMSNSKRIFATASTYSQMAAVLGNIQEYYCFGYSDEDRLKAFLG